MVDIALAISMREGKISSPYLDIPKHVPNNPTYSSICRLSYLMRGVLDSHVNLKLKLEEIFMKKYNFVYGKGFKSDSRNHGCFAKILSEIITQKQQDMNTRLMKELKFKCVQRSVDHKKLSNDSRMTKENKSFFGIIKNVQYMHKTEEMNCRCIERLLETTPDEI